MGLFVQAATVAVGEETGRRGEVMVEVTVGRRLSEQWRGRGDTAWQGAGPTLACRAGEPAGQARPEEREVGGASPGREVARGVGGRGLGSRQEPPKEEEGGKKKGKEKGEKEKGKKEK
jgi:hypothetical protein